LITQTLLTQFQHIMKKTFLSILLGFAALASLSAQETGALSGKVVDSEGEPLAGAGIIVKGTTTGFITDFDGNYSISGVTFPTTVVVSFIGFEDTEFVLTGKEKSPHILKLESASNALSEVVVVGFGTQKKSSLSGAVGVIDGAVLNQRPVVSAVNALQGADPSINISTSNGSPNSTASINIRGSLSLNGGSALVLIDGVEGELALVNPNDIESVSVLKDASTCAIYGAKASAGVVLVTTKQGKTGKANITYGYTHGWIQPTTDMDVMTCGYDHISTINYFQQHSFHNSRKNEYDYTVENGELLKLFERRNDVTEDPSRPWVEVGDDGYYHYYGNYDWFNTFYNTNRPTNEHNLSVSGGVDKVKYYVGGRYLDEAGLLKGGLSDKYKSYSIRSKIDVKINKYINYSNNISYSKKLYSWDGNSNMEATLENLWRYGSPAFSPYNPDGSLVNYPIELATAAKTNMMGNYATQALSGKNHNSRDLGNFTMTNKVDIIPYKGITISGQYDYRRYDTYNTQRTGVYYWSNQPGVINQMAGMTDSYTEERDWRQVHIGTVTAQYENNWDAHYFKVIVGGQYEASHTSDLTTKGTPVLVDGYNSFALIDQSTDENGVKKATYVVDGSASEYATLGFFGRANYDYKGKYIAEISARYDGTSRFSEKNRWGFFPSASVAWRFSEENFMKNLRNFWSNGKIRVSAGSLGNQQVSNYYYIETISIDNTLNYTFDGASKGRYASISSPVSSNLTWETVTTYDVGLDLGFFSNRLNFSGDYFIRDTKNMLSASVALPEVFGATEPKENCADLRTYGWELSLSWNDKFNLAGQPFSYSISAALGDNDTYITRYLNPTGTLSSHYVGERLGDIWGFRSGGLFKTDEEALDYTTNVLNSKEFQPGYYYAGGGVCVDGEGAKAGDFKLLDRDGDGVLSKGKYTLDDHGDLEIIGNTRAHLNYSFRFEFNWYGIDVSLFFQGIGRKDWFPTGDYGGYAFWGPYSSTSVTFIHKNFMSNVWSESNPDAYFPRPRGYSAYTDAKYSYWTGIGVKNDYFLQNIGYLRLKNCTVGYTLPQVWTRKIAVEKFRIFFSGENLFYASPIKNVAPMIDPELASASGTATSNTGVGYLYPRTFSIGATITF